MSCRACGNPFTDPEAAFCSKCGKNNSAPNENCGYDVIIHNGALRHANALAVERPNFSDMKWKELHEMIQLLQGSILELCLWKKGECSNPPFDWPLDVHPELANRGMHQDMYRNIRTRCASVAGARSSSYTYPRLCIFNNVKTCVLLFVFATTLAFLLLQYQWYSAAAAVFLTSLLPCVCVYWKRSRNTTKALTATLEDVATINKDLQSLGLAMGIVSIHGLNMFDRDSVPTYSVHQEPNGDVFAHSGTYTDKVIWEVAVFFAVQQEKEAPTTPAPPLTDSSPPPYSTDGPSAPLLQSEFKP